MNGSRGPVDWIAGRSHPRLGLLVVLGAAVAVVGVAVAVLGPPLGLPVETAGFRLAIVGALVFSFGGTGYVAFVVFEAAER